MLCSVGAWRLLSMQKQTSEVRTSSKSATGDGCRSTGTPAWTSSHIKMLIH
jgi:hypothetical protein